MDHPFFTQRTLASVVAVPLVSLVVAWGFVGCGDSSPRVERAELAIAANATTPSTLILPSGVQLDVPSGASSVPMTIVMETEPSSRRGANASTNIVATPLVLSPEGATFDVLLSLTIPIDPKNLPAGTTIDDVQVLTAPHGSTAYMPLPTRRAPVGNAVIADTMHFSDFVAVVIDKVGPVDASVGPVDASVGPVDAGAPNGLLHVFITSVQYNGNLGGFAGADAKCMADSNRPTNATYKALLVGASRSICPMGDCVGGSVPVDWVFKATTPYHVGPVGAETVAFTTDTNAIVSTFPLGAFLGAPINFWLGTNAWSAGALNCGDFGDASPGNSASVGWGNDLASNAFAAGMIICSDPASLLCVEQ